MQVVVNSQKGLSLTKTKINATKMNSCLKKPEGNCGPKVTCKASAVHKITHNSPHCFVAVARHSLEDSLADRDSNGGIAGSNLRKITETDCHVDVTGINDHQMVDNPIAMVGGTTETQHRPVITIYHQCVCDPLGRTTHSCMQLEQCGNKVNKKSLHVEGGITAPEGHIIPLSVRNGLPQIKIRPFTDNEWDALPHVIVTSDADWDPTVFDHAIHDLNAWRNTVYLM